jgi:putative flippase GtrA
MIRKITLFCTSGLLSAIVDLAIFNVLYFSGVPFTFSRIIGILSAISFNFVFNRNITFNSKIQKKRVQFIRHLIVYLGVLIINASVSNLVLILIGETGVRANIASVIGIIAAIPFSFTMSLLWTFKKTKQKGAKPYNKVF